jgi:flagellar basal-body rod protein FlgB
MAVLAGGVSMSSSISGLLDVIAQKMSYLTQKQSVLAENVANADTPGYKQLDMQPFTFGDAMRQTNVGMTTTDPRHIVPASMAGVNAKTFAVKGGETLASGNSVDLEDQMMAVSKTGADYQTMTSIYHKMAGMFKIAIKSNST